MKEVLSLLIGLLIVSCANNQRERQTKALSTNDSTIQLDSNRGKLVDPFFHKQYVDSIRDTSKFLLVESHEIVVNSRKISVQIYMIPNWGDPGDFLRIKIYENQILQLDEFWFDLIVDGLPNQVYQ